MTLKKDSSPSVEPQVVLLHKHKFFRNLSSTIFINAESSIVLER